MPTYHIKYEPSTRPRTLLKVCCGGGWSKGILEFRFGPNIELRLEAWTKLNNMKTVDQNIYNP